MAAIGIPEPQRETRSNPDPSTLTTAQLDKATVSLQSLLEAVIHGNQKIVETRLKCADDDAKSLKDQLKDEISFIKDQFKEGVSSLKDLHDEKFHGVTD